MARVTILSGAATSSAADLGDARVVGVVLPATFTGTTMTFSVSADGTNYKSLRDGAGAAVSITVAQDQAIGLSAAIQSYLKVARWVKAVSGSNEGADRVVELVEGPL